MPIYLWNGSILLEGGKIATNEECCCEEEGICYGSYLVEYLEFEISDFAPVCLIPSGCDNFLMQGIYDDPFEVDVNTCIFAFQPPNVVIPECTGEVQMFRESSLVIRDTGAEYEVTLTLESLEGFNVKGDLSATVPYGGTNTFTLTGTSGGEACYLIRARATRQ